MAKNRKRAKDRGEEEPQSRPANEVAGAQPGMDSLRSVAAAILRPVAHADAVRHAASGKRCSVFWENDKWYDGWIVSYNEDTREFAGAIGAAGSLMHVQIPNSSHHPCTVGAAMPCPCTRSPAR